MLDYEEFIEDKKTQIINSGFMPDEIHPQLFDYQQAIVKWAIRRGRAAIFADTGLGKTLMQLEWAKHVQAKTNGKILILAPLCVSDQTANEAPKIDLLASIVTSQPDIPGVHITNYEKLHNFEPSEFSGIILDESSILKSLTGKTRRLLIDAASTVPYRLSCTATPSPNDYVEFGGQSEFLGIMNTAEMLASFFIHDGGDTSKWRLKGHGAVKFWEWVASWAVYIKKPSDIGFSDEGFDLPPPIYHEHVVGAKPQDGYLFPVHSIGLSERIKARRDTIDDRVDKCAEIVNNSSGQWIIWCNLNDESEKLSKLIDGGIDIRGSEKPEIKIQKITDFQNGKTRALITKPSIAGFGLNWQHCHNVAFVGLNDSYEQFYQALRRCWRFGQKKQVNVHIISAETEAAVVENIKRKEAQAEMSALTENMKKFMKQNINGNLGEKLPYKRDHIAGDGWDVMLGDCVDISKEIESNSIDYTIFSPPFASLYTYSNSDRDMGNCSNKTTFYKHFGYLVDELFRITAHGRDLSFHCFNIPMMKSIDGEIGLFDFRGDLIKMFQQRGFIFHSETVIWKDPVTQMQRTKALGLLHKTIRKDSSMSRMGLPDYVVTMRKPGVNAKPISHTPEDFPVSLWQKYASPVWFDINSSNTLNKNGAREEEDERHICPLQLDVIERCLRLWSNPNDLIYSPFTGIGSEGYMAVKMGRRFLGAELKESYYHQAVRNIKSIAENKQMELM